MNTDKLAKRVAIAQEALRSFLSTLLGTEAPLFIEDAIQADFDEVNLRSKANITFTAGTSPEDQWAVVLDPEWLPVLSKSMLGEPMEFGEPGSEDLLRELAAQAHGAVRTQLASSGRTLKEADVQLLARGSELGNERFGPILFEVPFQLMVEGRKLEGFALMPPVDFDAPAPMESEPDEVLETDDLLETSDVEPTPIPPAAESDSLEGGVRQPSISVAPVAFADLGPEAMGGGGDGLDAGFALLADVELEVTVELGRRKIPLAEVLRLTTGSVIELEKLVGEPLEVYANGRLIAEGEAVVMDEQFGIRITNLASNRPRQKAFV